jgi:hypothetical protein
MQMKVRLGTYNQKHQASDQRNRIEVEVGGGVIRIEEVVAVVVEAVDEKIIAIPIRIEIIRALIRIMKGRVVAAK